MSILPSGGTATMTRLGTVSFAAKSRFDASGLTTPSGQTVRYPLLVGAVSVILSAIAVTPEVGTGPTPDTVTARVPDAPSERFAAPTPWRVSSRRCGVTGM